jgi:hypothetical protein
MFELLEKLRGKSERSRKLIALGFSFCVMLVILIIWATVLFPDWSASQSQQAKAVASSPSPLSTFGATIGDGFSAIGAQFGELKNTMSSITTPQPTVYEATTTQ